MNERWARIQDGIAFEFTAEDPAGRFHESLIFVKAPDDAVVGSRYVNGKWLPPLLPPLPPQQEPQEPQEPAPPAYRTLMTPIRFKAQFSVGEQVAIKRARAYSGDNEEKAFARDALDILFGSLDDPRLAEVDVADPSVIGGIDFCQSIGILTAERAAAIKLGVFQPTP